MSSLRLCDLVPFREHWVEVIRPSGPQADLEASGLMPDQMHRHRLGIPYKGALPGCFSAACAGSRDRHLGAYLTHPGFGANFDGRKLLRRVSDLIRENLDEIAIAVRCRNLFGAKSLRVSYIPAITAAGQSAEAIEVSFHLPLRRVERPADTIVAAVFKGSRVEAMWYS